MADSSQTRTVSLDDLLNEFTTRAEPVGMPVQRASDSAAAASVLASFARELQTNAISASGELRMAAPRLIATLESAGVSCWTPVDAIDAKDAALGLSLARLAVAETGSMLLAEENLADRAVGLVSAAQVIVCPTRALVPSLVEASWVLREIALRPGGGYSTFVTGPSRTADIEMSLTVGVQGPAKVFALFIDDPR